MNVTKEDDKKSTRRTLLKTGLAVAGGVVAAARAEAQAKIAPAMVQYQDKPKDGQRCDACVNWEAPNACKIVSGTIAPAGWCIAFAAKQP